MQHQKQFIRQSAAVLLACGLITSLLPDLAAAQDQPAREKALFDVATISMVIGAHLGKPWLTLVEPSVVLGPDEGYRWKRVDAPSTVRIIRDIDQEAMKADFFNILNGKPTALPPIEGLIG
jgi:hypothetical protein